MKEGTTNNSVPFLVAVMGIGTFASMDVVMKFLALGLGAYNALLWRIMVTVILAGALFFWRRSPWPTRQAMRLHIWRGSVTSVMAYLFFWALIHVPLAEAIALSFIAPLIALYLAAVLLGERITRISVIASVVGFSGVLVIMTGKIGSDYGEQAWLGVVAILVSAVLYAYNLILQRQQAIIASPPEIAFFQNLVVFSIYLLFAPFLAEIPPLEFMGPVVLAAVFGFSSILLLSWSYARAEARILIPVEYTAFVWAAIGGWIMFGEIVTLTTLAGTVLIVSGCLVAARQR